MSGSGYSTTPTLQLIKITGATAAGSFTIPANSFIAHIAFRENLQIIVDGGLKFGWTVGGTQIAPSIPVGIGGSVDQGFATEVEFSQRWVTGTTVYYDAVSAWDGAEVDLWILYSVLS